MITIKKSEDNTRFVMADGETTLGSVGFDHVKAEITDFLVLDPATEFVLVNLIKAVLNHFDLSGFPTVFYFKNEHTEVLLKQGFQKTEKGLALSLDCYFDKKCCGQEKQNGSI